MQRHARIQISLYSFCLQLLGWKFIYVVMLHIHVGGEYIEEFIIQWPPARAHAGYVTAYVCENPTRCAYEEHKYYYAPGKTWTRVGSLEMHSHLRMKLARSTKHRCLFIMKKEKWRNENREFRCYYSGVQCGGEMCRMSFEGTWVKF